VKADIASYGKVAGGEFPLGIVAGKKEWIDALDGGFWQFGDASKPEVGVTYFAGTFVRHPPALAAAKAALTKLKEENGNVQKTLNARTQSFVDSLNALAAEAKLPLQAKCMGSLWRATFSEDQTFGDLMFVWLRYNGLHIWDGFPCFFTTAHTDEVASKMLAVFRKTIAEMQACELLGGAQLAPQGTLEGEGSMERLFSQLGLKTSSTELPPGARLGKNSAGEATWFVASETDATKFVEWKKA
jgi:glutamate-1-semialdehyde aminotransferase